MIEETKLPESIRRRFSLPKGYIIIHKLGLTNLQPWYFLNHQEAIEKYIGLSTRYPSNILLPFARRQDNDDVACFVVTNEKTSLEKILIIHDYASLGSEVDGEYDSFWEWFRIAVTELIEFQQYAEDVS